MSLLSFPQPPIVLHCSKKSLQANVNQHFNLQMFWLERQKKKKILIAMDTKMQGLGCVTKAEKDEQILWFAGAVRFWISNCSVHSTISPSHAANYRQGRFQSFVLSCNRSQSSYIDNLYNTVSSLLSTKPTVNISKYIMTTEKKQTEILTWLSNSFFRRKIKAISPKKSHI